MIFILTKAAVYVILLLEVINMFTIDKEVITEQVIKKSLFITHLAPVTSIEEANDYLKSIRKKHYEATHNCYSYIIDKEGLIYKNSDDGEPSQTAGIIIYDVLQKNNLTNIICVVTRYFGGIKLGAGGLIRAYSSSAANAVKIAKLVEIISLVKMLINTPYQYTNELLSYMNEYESVNKIFTEDVSLEYIVPESKIEQIKNDLINMTKNNIKIEVF